MRKSVLTAAASATGLMTTKVPTGTVLFLSSASVFGDKEKGDKRVTKVEQINEDNAFKATVMLKSQKGRYYVRFADLLAFTCGTKSVMDALMDSTETEEFEIPESITIEASKALKVGDDKVYQWNQYKDFHTRVETEELALEKMSKKQRKTAVKPMTKVYRDKYFCQALIGTELVLNHNECLRVVEVSLS